jgi:hypothetical protein
VVTAAEGAADRRPEHAADDRAHEGGARIDRRRRLVDGLGRTRRYGDKI